MSRRAALLVEPAWLAEHLQDPDLRILDCTTYMVPQPVGASTIVSGLPDYERGHVPGAQHVDMVEDMSAPDGEFPYTLPSAGQMEQLMSRLGVANHHHIVLYGRGHIPTITRCWYVLHALGHERVSVLNGGMERWEREGWPLTTDIPRFAPTNYQAELRSQKVASLADVRQASSANDATLLINALGRDQFAGSGGAHYGRPGRIPASVNVPARELADQDTKMFVPDEVLHALFAPTGALEAPRVIAYCGGGIAASAVAFALEILGHPDWALYDNSLLEWSTRTDTAMEID